MNEKKAPSKKILRNRLLAIVDRERGTMKSKIAQDALEYETASKFFHDLPDRKMRYQIIESISCGQEAQVFFDKYYIEIDVLRWEHKGQFELDCDIKVFFAWFAIMETGSRIAKQIGLEGL
jgi:hypothetical protein